MMSSAGFTGETMICSMVWRSFSRTIEREVATTAESIMSIATSPGTRNLALCTSGLNQMRGSSITAGTTGGRPALARASSRTLRVARSASASR